MNKKAQGRNLNKDHKTLRKKSPDDFQRMTFKEDAESPINISYVRAREVILPELFWENSDTKPLKMEIINTGHTVLLAGVWGKQKPMLSGGPLTSKYKFLQLHFHWGRTNDEGSFHTYDNEALPLEMHAVFLKNGFKSQEEALKHSDGMIVLVYVYKLNESGNKSIDVISQLCPWVQMPGKSVFCPPMEIGSLLYPFSHDYFVYWGSMKVNETNHVMLWLLCRHPFSVSNQQIQRLRSLLNDSKNSSGDTCQVKLPDSKENSLFLVSPSSSFESTLYGVESKTGIDHSKISEQKETMAQNSDNQERKLVVKACESRKEISESGEESSCYESPEENVVAIAIRAIRTALEIQSSELPSEAVEAQSTSKSSDNKILNKDSPKPEFQSKIRRETTFTELTASSNRSSDVASSVYSETDSCESQVQANRRLGKERGSRANCTRSKIQFCQDKFVPECSRTDYSTPQEASGGSDAGEQNTGHEAGLFSIKDSVLRLRDHYRGRKQPGKISGVRKSGQAQFSNSTAPKTTNTPIPFFRDQKSNGDQDAIKTALRQTSYDRRKVTNRIINFSKTSRQKKKTTSRITKEKENSSFPVSESNMGNSSTYHSKKRRTSSQSSTPKSNLRENSVLIGSRLKPKENSTSSVSWREQQRSPTAPEMRARHIVRIPIPRPSTARENSEFDDKSMVSRNSTRTLNIRKKIPQDTSSKSKKNEIPRWRY